MFNNETYNKVDVILRDIKAERWANGLKSSIPAKTHYTFDNASLAIMGNSLIITIEESTDGITGFKSKVFDLNEVDIFRAQN